MSSRNARNKRRKQRKRQRRQQSYNVADRLLEENVKVKMQRSGGSARDDDDGSALSTKRTVQRGKNALDKLFERGESAATLPAIGKKVLAWMVRPISLDKFMAEYYECKPLLVRCKQEKQLTSLLSKEDIFAWLKEGKLNARTDLTLTRYANGKRETVDVSSAGEAFVRDAFQNQQCSVRLLRPSQLADSLYRFVSSLEAYFCSCGGSNAYLTPANSQGFAPHYDDIDAFVIQLEGRKRWKVYKPYEGDDEQLHILFPRLPRHSSQDFTQEQVASLQVAYDTELLPGDVLYLPRGTVHQAKAPKDVHSLHVTISTGQKSTWADLLAMAVPNILQGLISDGNKDTEHLRKSLPVNFMDFMGVMHSDQSNDKRRETFTKMLSEAVSTVVDAIDPDTCADQLSKRFQHERHNPSEVVPELPSTVNQSPVSLESLIRLRVKYGATLTVESDAVVVYHSMKNTKKFCEVPERGLEFDLEDAEAIETILKYSPSDNPIRVADLPCETDDDKLRIVQFLHTEGIVDLVED